MISAFLRCAKYVLQHVRSWLTWVGTPLKTIRQVSWFRGRMRGFSLHRRNYPPFACAVLIKDLLTMLPQNVKNTIERKRSYLCFQK